MSPATRPVVHSSVRNGSMAPGWASVVMAVITFMVEAGRDSLSAWCS